MNRILISVQSLINYTDAWRDMGELADEINSALPDCECSLVHLDTGNFLAFVKQDPTEGEYWRGLEEENQELTGESDGTANHNGE